MFATVSSSRPSRTAPGRGKPTQAALVLQTGEVARISVKVGKVKSCTVAIDTTPALFTLAWLVTSEDPVVTIRERVAFWENQNKFWPGEKGRERTRSETIYSTPARRTLTLAVILIAIPKLAACGRGKETIKTRRTFVYTDTLTSPADKRGRETDLSS